MQRRRLLVRTACSAATLAAPALLRAQSSPPMRVIVPFAPGGPIDVTVRLLAEQVRPSLGTVVVENRAGGGGNIGVEALVRAAPDGRTLGIATTASHAINPWLFRRLPYDTERDFAPVTLMLRVPNVLVVNAASASQRGIGSLADLIAYAKAHPAALSYASGGNGSAGHLAGELFKQRLGVFAVHIPYGGGNPAQLALVSGQVDFNFDNLATAAPNIRAGKLKPLAVTTLQPSPLLPGVPTVAASLPGFEIDTWWGLVAPAGTPPEVVARLNRAFVEALNAPEVRARFATLMAEPAPGTPEAFAAFLRGERTKYRDVVRLSGAQVD